MSNKLWIGHVNADVTALRELRESGALIRETPHLGALLVGKYALMAAGLANCLVIVDTIKAGRDKFGQVRDVDGVRLMSNAESEGMLAAAATRVVLSQERLKQLQYMCALRGIDANQIICDGSADLVALHMHVVGSVVADGVAVSTFAESWREAGETGLAMMQHLASRGLLERYYHAGEQRFVHIEPDDDQLGILREQGRYFDEDSEGHGVVPPVEAMLALQVVRSVLTGRSSYDHLYRLSSVYTQDEGVLHRIGDIAQGTLAELGIVDGEGYYGLLLVDNDHLDMLGGRRDQFDLYAAGARYDLNSLLAQSEGTES